MSKRKILVAGSINTDMVVKSFRLPSPGETVTGGEFYMHTGGKGANQAVASAKLGADTCLIAKTGADLFGLQARSRLQEQGVDTSLILQDGDSVTGTALIMVDEKGENCISVAPGANTRLTAQDISHCAGAFPEADVILLQLEIPMAAVEAVLNFPRKNGSRLIVNPAPAEIALRRCMKSIDILTPNQSEASLLTGVEIHDKASAVQAATELLGMGAGTVIITMGAGGALLADQSGYEIIPAPAVTAVDTTGAGDVFNGALAFALAGDEMMADAVKFACLAASISVTRRGAQESAPSFSEVNDFRRRFH